MAGFDPNAASGKDSGIFGLLGGERDAGVVVIAVPFDATTSYRAGTHKGPAAIFEASKQVDLFDLETGKPYEAGIFMRPISEQVLAWNSEARAHAEIVIEEGGVVAGDKRLEDAASACNALCTRMNDWVYAQTREVLAAGKLVSIVGGDHSVPFGAIKAIAEAYPGVSVLHLDAHADLRAAYEGFDWSHASIMYNVMEKIPGVSRLVQVGIRDFGEQEYEYIQKNEKRIRTYFDARLKQNTYDGETWRAQCERIVAELGNDVYLSFDIDGLNPKLCPNTGTPVPGGLEFTEVTALLTAIHRAGKRIVGLDLNEVAPAVSGEDEWDANVGARLLYKMIGFALLKA